MYMPSVGRAMKSAIKKQALTKAGPGKKALPQAGPGKPMAERRKYQETAMKKMMGLKKMMK